MTNLAQGIARTIEKHIGDIYHTETNKVVVAPPPVRITAATPRPISVSALDDERGRAAFLEFVSKERNRLAIKKVTSERVRACRAKMKALEANVQEEMARAGVSKVAIQFADGDNVLEIVPKRGTMEGGDDDEDGEGEVATNRALMPSALGVIKLRELMTTATEEAMRELGINPAAAFTPAAAVQALGHPQLRALINLRMKSLTERAMAEKAAAARVAGAGSGSSGAATSRALPASRFDVRFKTARA